MRRLILIGLCGLAAAGVAWQRFSVEAPAPAFPVAALTGSWICTADLSRRDKAYGPLSMRRVITLSADGAYAETVDVTVLPNGFEESLRLNVRVAGGWALTGDVLDFTGRSTDATLLDEHALSPALYAAGLAAVDAWEAQDVGRVLWAETEERADKRRILSLDGAGMRLHEQRLDTDFDCKRI